MEEYLSTDGIMPLQNALAGYEKFSNLTGDLSFSPIRQSRRVLLFRRLGESASTTNARRIKMLWTTEGEVPFPDEGYEFVEIRLEQGTSCSVYQVGEDTFFFTQDRVLAE
jgi:hypothetical protein